MSVTIEIKNALKKYGENTIIPDLSLSIKPGEFFTLLGPSGCGKTTLLRMIAGFNSIEGGDFYFNDKRINDLDPAKRNIGMVFQNYAIFPHLTVRKNVEFGLKNKKYPKAEISKQADKFMKLMHVDEYADRLPERLSGGQQQRVALARALCIEPDVLLMDEPLSNLDAKLRVEMRSVIKQVQNSVGITTVYVTHDQEEVKGKGLVRIDGGPSRSPNATHTLTPGNHTVTVEVQNVSAFPALYIDNPLLKTDETWTADCLDACERPVGCEPAFERVSDDLTVFPFCYEPIEPVSEEQLNDGILYDFGKETFGPVSLHQHLDHGSIRLCYGETREEALDYEYAVARETLPAYEGKNCRPPRAFRYLFVQAERGTPEISAQLEYLPIEDVADFKTEDALVNKIWRICSDTVHHCCREFYVDGIKRDRWVWSLDAYVSFWIAQYLFDDPAIARRTIRALLGKPPYTQHINTINEYSSYLIILLFEYYQATGDLSFVESNWPEICSLYAFIRSRLNEDGYVVKRAGDWLFIDWTEMDKTDPVCVEQIILWQTHKIMGQLCQILGEDGTECFRAADRLQKKIIHDYYDPQNHILISSFKDSVPYITRHAAIMAILYDFFDEETSLELKQAVLMNDSIAPITTPVWKFLELMAIGKFGEIRQIQEYILSYWGGMIKQGATSIWEEYDPTGTESSMYYGLPHRLSLCHFWGGGPIALFGKYCAGVSATSVGGKTFDVAPQPGLYNQFVAKVPMNHGVVTVEYENHTVRVSSTVPGGTLRFAGKACVIPSDGSSVSLAEQTAVLSHAIL